MIQRPVGEVLGSKKESGLVTVNATATVFDAVRVMIGRGAGSVVVKDAQGGVAGIFTERDLLRRVVGEGKDPKATTIASVMTPDVRKVPPSEPVMEVLRVMVEHGYRHMMVGEDGRTLGIVSIRDLMAWAIMPDAPIAHEGRRGVIYTKAGDAVEELRKG
jgi:CBS domain-containing protein